MEELEFLKEKYKNLLEKINKRLGAIPLLDLLVQSVNFLETTSFSLVVLVWVC